MSILLPTVIGIGLIALLVRLFLTTPPVNLARYLRLAGGVTLLATGVGLLFMRQFGLALPVGMAGFMILRRHAPIGATRPTDRRSSVRTAGLDMTLDHASGEMDGRLLSGRHRGRMLSELKVPELLQCAEDFAGDPETRRLLESYLDRAHAGWREDLHADEAQRRGAPSRAGGMSTQEAYQILGLEPGAGEAEVREAHRRLMKQVHPDRGGSAALAAQINEAKERILGKHR
jgi:hypothetical protein